MGRTGTSGEADAIPSVSSRRQHRALWLSLRVAGVTGALALGATGVVAAHAAPRRATVAASPAAKSATPSPLVTLPTVGPGISPAARPQGQLIGAADTENLAVKTLTVVTFPRTYVLIQTLSSTESNGDQNNDAWVISNPTTVKNRPDDHISFGAFPVVMVSTLAFGVLPLQATLTATQVVEPNGIYEPLDAQFRGDSTGVGGFYTLSGRLEVHLSDVFVDGHPLNLSPACRTVTPAQLVAHATGDPSDPRYYNPFRGGPFSGAVVIPAFTGCSATPFGATRAEDLDALLDGTISGGGNATFLAQTGAGFFDENQVGDCAPTSNPNSCVSAPPIPRITGSTPVPTPSPASSYPPPKY